MDLFYYGIFLILMLNGLLEEVRTLDTDNNEACGQFNELDGHSQFYLHGLSPSNHNEEIHFQYPAEDHMRSKQAEEATEIPSSNKDTTEGETKDHTCKDLLPSATFVTALYDIGRGDWDIFPRPYFIYQNYFKDVLKLNVNMVVFVNKTDEEFVWENRREAELVNSTRVWTKSFNTLPLHRHLSRVTQVVQSEAFKDQNNNLRHPEAFSPDYIILMNSKLSLLKEVVVKNPFCSSHFVWIDAGYGHGKGILPPDGAPWVPHGLIDVREKVTIIQLERPILYEHYSIQDLFKLGARSAFIGGFFGGDAVAIKQLTALHKDVFEEFLDNGLVHEDQMMMLMCYFRKPEYFNAVEGWWYDGYKLFH